MFYLPEQDLLFIHIPRTGGTSYKRFLENYGTNTDIELFDNHSPVQTACYFLDNADANTKLSIVRNPYAREVSLWRFGRAGALAASDMTFEYWCRWRFQGRPKDASNLLTYLDPVTVTALWGMHKTPQILYLVDEDAKLRVDYIGCFERYEEIYDFTRKKFHEDYGYVKHVAMQNGTPWTRKLNQSEMDWRLIYEQQENTQEVLDMVYEFYDWDFETFGYNKDWMNEDDSPSRNIGEMPKPSSDPYIDMMSDWPLKQFYGDRRILLADALSYRFMPEGKNRGVFLQNTIGLKIGDVTLRED
jgi:hypothetical protein